jgi:isopentenyldiphosphate isomerase
MIEDEWIALVTPTFQHSGAIPRSLMRNHGLPHRASFIFLFSFPTRKLVLTKRTMTKDFCPGWWDACIGGVVAWNEVDNALRELEEEVGLTPSDLIRMDNFGEFFYQDEGSKVWGDMYVAVFDHGEDWRENLTLQVEEVDDVMLVSPEDVVGGVIQVTPDSRFAVAKLLQDVDWTRFLNKL